ncbi:MAG: prealbumin-like fold domain-containing protein, partial [Lachnospiraceae bacterium]|nr:prealbumin-like fold domain-containing protein [Lachnospiraceae bacterium]
PTQRFYILHETSPPDGYRSQPVDIVLEYNSQTTMLSVANRWETGAYASFTSYVSEQAGVKLIYGQYNTSTGLIEKGTGNVPDSSREEGLVLAVPMLQRGEKNSTVWLPLYGSNLDGFHTTGVEGADEEGMKKALLTAALNQCLYEDGWYLEWNAGKKILEGSLSDLPGRADRYRHENPNGDMQMAYIIIEPAALAQITNGAGNSTERYTALKQYAAANGVNAAVNAIYDGSAGANVHLLDTAQFIRVFRSLIYISNEQRELRVMKVDENGQPLNGAQFGLYASIEDAQQERNAVATGETANVDGVDGILIFKPQTDGGPGYAGMVWANALDQPYYLKEISAPKGYGVNETIIPVVVGIYSIYADAGAAGDGVSVMAGAGQLYRTMAKYASDGDVNITLRDITVTAQWQDSGQFVLDGWQDIEESGQKQEKNLHYDRNREMGMDYGLHDEDLGSTPFFRTDTGFLRVRVSQNTQALRDELYNGAVNIANWDDLKDTDLTGLFSLLNIVVVEDRKTGNSGDNDDHEDDSGMTDTDMAEMGTNAASEVKTSPTALDVLVERIGTPQTGDDSLMWWWALLGMISLVGIGATVC